MSATRMGLSLLLLSMVAACGGNSPASYEDGDAGADGDSDADTDADADGDADTDSDSDADADTDADTDADGDTDTDGDTDADTDGDTDADTDSDTDADTEPDCGEEGVPLWGICWYLGELGASCDDTCLAHGGYNDATPEYVGIESQGGSLEECQSIFDALGATATVSEGANSPGYGCHFWQGSGYWWLNNTAFDPSASGESVREVCGCNGDSVDGD